MFFLSLGRFALLSSALLLLLAGCSDNRMAEVTGIVTVDGQPVEKGDISFFPVDGNGPTAGDRIVNGKYLATKVPVGTMKVQIRVPKASGQKKQLYESKDGKESPVRDIIAETLPKKFNDDTELRFDVKPGKNEKNWDLSTK